MSNRRTILLGIGSVTLALCLSGCSLVSSLEFDDRLLVKLPGDQKKSVPDDKEEWNFRHVVEGPRRYPGDWYLVWQRYHSTSTHLAFPWSRWVYARENALSVAEAAHREFQVYPLMIEPDFVFTTAAARVDAPTPPPASASNNSADVSAKLQVRELPSGAWPEGTDDNGDISVRWYQDDKHTQLTKAVNKIGEGKAGLGIRIGILDDGFSAGQAGLPDRSQLDDEPAGDAMGTLLTDDNFKPVAPGSTGGTHGTAALGILAGRRICIKDQIVNGHKIADFAGYIGGVPHARIVLVRVAPWVISLSTANMAYGIDYASRRRHCDVLSISNGGAPCEIWVDAVNAAYERGTAMFAAEGDFYSVVPEPFQPLGIVVPASPVYPASFRTVMGVTGVTADGDSYAENNLGRLLTHPLAIGQWIARGTYGAKGTWNSVFGINDEPDRSIVKRNGALRAYPIAAYSPNMPWLVAASQGDPTNNYLDLNGSGTSAATPQVAAAAALWLGYHRAEFDRKEWNSWKKPEAVYDALLMSAYRRPDKKWPDLYLGAGTLKADDALKIDLGQIENPATHLLPTGNGSLTLTYARAPEDYYDGDRSFTSLFGLAADLTTNDRADLDQRRRPHLEKEEALTRLFYNTMLLEAWHAGDLPKRTGAVQGQNWRENLPLEQKAQKLAQESIRNQH